MSDTHRPLLVELREQGLANKDGHVFHHRQTLGNAYDDARSSNGSLNDTMNCALPA